MASRIARSNDFCTAQELAALSINERMLLCASSVAVDQKATSGSASEKAYIGESSALNRALAHAGMTSADASIRKNALDSEDDRMVYEIEFRAGGYKSTRRPAECSNPKGIWTTEATCSIQNRLNGNAKFRPACPLCVKNENRDTGNHTGSYFSRYQEGTTVEKPSYQESTAAKLVRAICICSSPKATAQGSEDT